MKNKFFNKRLTRWHHGIRFTSLFLACIFALICPLATAQVYQWRDQDGKVHFTDTPPETGGTLDKEIKLKTTVPAVTANPAAKTKNSDKTPAKDKTPTQKDPNDPNLNVSQVLEAMKYVVTTQATVQAHIHQCSKAEPGTTRYTESKKYWSDQNQDILKKMEAIKTPVLLFNGINNMDGYFEKIESDTRRTIDQQYATAPAAKKAADCTTVSRDIHNGRYDIAGDRIRHDHITNFFNWYLSGK